MTKYTYILISLVCMFNLLAAAPSMAKDNQIEGSRGCVATRALKNTEVVDDQIVLFYMRGKTVYLNVLPEQCKGLYQYGRFTYTTLSGSLCHFDTIRVLVGGGYPGRSCRLGNFYLIDKEDIPAIIASRYRPAAPGPLAPADVEEIFSETEEPKKE